MSANLKSAQDAFGLQAKMALGDVTPAMFAEFSQKFPGYFLPTFDCSTNDGAIDLKNTDLMSALKAFMPIWNGFKNSSVTNTKIEPADASGKVITIEQEYKNCLLDHAGNVVEGTQKTFCNTHTWHYNDDGKVMKWHQTFDQKVLDHSRGLEKEANAKIFAKTMEIWGLGMKMWGEGALGSTNPDQKANADKIWAADVVFDATFPMDYTDGLKKYVGIDQGMEYMKYLENWDMPDFNVYHTAMGPKGEVIAMGSYTPTIKSTGKTGPKVDFVQKCVIDTTAGKFSEIRFYWGPTMALVDACFAPGIDAASPVPASEPEPAHDKDFAKAQEAWGACMGAWGAGKLTDPIECAKVCAPDALFDVRYPSKTNAALRQVYRGPAGCVDWCTALSGFDFSSFSVDHVAEGPDGTLLFIASDAAVLKATGKAGERSDFVAQCAARDGKVAMFKWFWGAGNAARDALFIPDAKKQWVVEHKFVPGKAEEWWAGTAKMMADPAAFAAWTARQAELGFVNHHFMPQAMGGDADMMCIWETKEEVTAKQFQQFIDGPDGPSFGALVNTCHTALPGGIFPATGFKVNVPNIAKVEPTRGSFFWIHHEFKSADTAKQFWGMMGGMGPADMRAMGQKNHELGFHNHFFVPCGEAGPAFCVWESEKDLTVEEFQRFIDGPDGPGAGKIFDNACRKVAAGANVPSAKFPVKDAAATAKEAPESAAVANTMAMAA